jgi:hypothetical protein
MKSLVEMGTFALFETYISKAQALDRATGAFLRAPFTARSASRKAELRIDQGRIAGELVDRYDGIFSQVFTRSGIRREEWSSLVVAIWQGVASNASKDEPMCKTIWKVCSEVIDKQVVALKPKFMLRAFVDEMPSCDERGVLRDLAFGPRTIDYVERQAAERLRTIERAYPILHSQLMNRAYRLEELLDGVLNRNALLAMKAPFKQYDDWLFNC